jgi:hypothetical protein
LNILDLTNKVLVRLREDQVSTIEENATSLLVSEFVREALSVVEDARTWNVLRTSLVVVTVAGSYAYTLPNAGKSYSILYVHENTEDYDMLRAPSAQWMTHHLLTYDTQMQPRFYDINGIDSSSGDPVLNLYPVPDKEYQIDLAMKIKTAEDADETTTVLVPTYPVILAAYAMALEERGDDGGDSLSAIAGRYEQALADAITYDAALNADETVWVEE